MPSSASTKQCSTPTQTSAVLFHGRLTHVSLSQYITALFFMFFFFFNDTATTEIYTLSLHDALPISSELQSHDNLVCLEFRRDRKSTRLNSSHTIISYAVFCLKKKIHTMTRYTC